MSTWFRLFVTVPLVLALVSPPGAAVAQTPPSPPPPAMTIPSITPIPVSPGRPLTLQDAVGIGLQNNFPLRQSALNVVVARAQVQQAKAQTAINLGGNLRFQEQSVTGTPISGTITIPNVGTFPFTSLTVPQQTTWAYGLTLRYPLYTGNALQDQIAIANANEQEAEASFAAQAEQTVFSVRQAYYAVQAAQATVDADQRAVDAAQENVRVTEARVRAGASPQFDLLQAQVQLAQSQQTLVVARTQVVLAQQNLAAALSLPVSTITAPATPPTLVPPPQDLDPLVQEAFRQRPELQQVLAAEAAAQSAIDLAASGLRPNVELTGGPQVTTGDPTVHNNVIWTGLIALTITILDGGLTKAKVDAAKTQLAETKVTEEQTRQSIELDVRTAYEGLITGTEGLRAALSAQTAGREAVRIANVRFQAGVGTQLDVVTAIQNLATADNSVVQAAFTYAVSRAQLDRAVGIAVKF